MQSLTTLKGTQWVGLFIYLAVEAYLQVEELAVSPVDDVGGGIRVGDVDEVHLVRRGQVRTQSGPLGSKVTSS